jgi:hypothetical protein
MVDIFNMWVSSISNSGDFDYYIYYLQKKKKIEKDEDSKQFEMIHSELELKNEDQKENEEINNLMCEDVVALDCTKVDNGCTNAGDEKKEEMYVNVFYLFC